MSSMEKYNKHTNHNVTQSNHLIRAAYELSLNEKRLLMLALSKIDPTKWTQDWEITVFAKEWSDVYGRELKHAYGDLEHATTLIMDRKITFRTGPDVTEKKRTTETGRWVAWARYTPGDCKVTLEIPKGLRKYLAFAMLEEEGFTSYKLLAAGKLRSPNSIRMYEFLMQFKSTGMLIITVDELRERLELHDKYKLFSDLRKWVIDPAVNDINKNTDYLAEWEVHKRKGRKATNLRFTFKEKKQKEFDFGAPSLNKGKAA